MHRGSSLRAVERQVGRVRPSPKRSSGLLTQDSGAEERANRCLGHGARIEPRLSSVIVLMGSCEVSRYGDRHLGPKVRISFNGDRAGGPGLEGQTDCVSPQGVTESLAAPRPETQGAVPARRHEVSEVGTYWSRLHQPIGREGSESRAPQGELERQGEIGRSWCSRIATPSLLVSDSANCAGRERTLSPER